MSAIYRTAPRLIVDIETAVNLQTIKYMPEPEAPGNLKDPIKIAAAIEEKRQDQIDRAPLDPDYGEILTIGVMTDRDTEPTVFTGAEAAIISEFWRALADCAGQCIGYNIIGFDIPYILRRSMANGIKPKLLPNLAKYRTEPVTDLMGILYNWGPAKSLKQVAKIYGLPVDLPDVNGSMVADMTIEQVIAYQKSDVKLTKSLYDLMNGIYFTH